MTIASTDSSQRDIRAFLGVTDTVMPIMPQLPPDGVITGDSWEGVTTKT
ncbi:MAG: hypothetical protein KKF26_02505 [Chloroflexi bacterium]|nr:hypothetical protein [Chloroflexota bacterium]